MRVTCCQLPNGGSSGLHLAQTIQRVLSVQCLFNIHRLRRDRTLSVPVNRFQRPDVRFRLAGLHSRWLCSSEVSKFANLCASSGFTNFALDTRICSAAQISIRTTPPTFTRDTLRACYATLSSRTPFKHAAFLAMQLVHCVPNLARLMPRARRKSPRATSAAMLVLVL